MPECQHLPLLRFAPVFQQYLWGGRRLGSVLGKPIGDGPTFAESWEVVDHGDDQSIVEGGPFCGWTLSQLVKSHGEQLLGALWHQKVTDPSLPQHLKQRFPLLIKWLDSNKDLSIQVHPNDQQASQLTPPDLGKTEAWYIADALPGAKVYAGLKPGVDQATFADALHRNRIIDVMHSFEPKVGDCLFIPAGTVHALGAGLLVAEVQQSSNTTYRIYDWDRVGPDGKPRQLHIAESLAVTNFEAGPVGPQPISQKLTTNSDGTSIEVDSLVDCDYFKIDRLQVDDPITLPGNACRILICLQGAANIRVDTYQDAQSVQLGQTILAPFELGTLKITPENSATFLLAQLP